jgi:hypothetical protein
MPPRLDFLGLQLGRLTVVAAAGAPLRTRPSCRKPESAWLCRCKCGTEFLVWASSLTPIRGARSCGCFKRDVDIEKGRRMGKANRKHGRCGEPEYRSWKAMLERCGNPNHVAYKDYGGRGIKVCEPWMFFDNFFADMKNRPLGKTLDRKNVNKGYSKRNCRWATATQQAGNRRPSTDWTLDEEVF